MFSPYFPYPTLVVASERQLFHLKLLVSHSYQYRSQDLLQLYCWKWMGNLYICIGKLMYRKRQQLRNVPLSKENREGDQA